MCKNYFIDKFHQSTVNIINNIFNSGEGQITGTFLQRFVSDVVVGVLQLYILLYCVCTITKKNVKLATIS